MASLVTSSSTSSSSSSVALVRPSTVVNAATVSPSVTCATATPITSSRRSYSLTGAIPSAVMGPVKPLKGFFSNDVEIGISGFGGQYARGLIAKRKIAYGREILNVPAFATYTGDEPQREQVYILTRQVLADMVAKGTDDPYTKYCAERVFTMMSSGRQYFLRDQDLTALMDSVPNATNFVEKGMITSTDIQKLPQIIEFNRYDVEYRGKKGICVFPEASYFNHMCHANVEITISHDVNDGFVLSARASRPIEAGEELFINYIPDNDLPLSRLVIAMRKRWGFECQCSICRSRLMGVCLIYLVFFAVPFVFFVRSTFEDRFKDRARRLG